MIINMEMWQFGYWLKEFLLQIPWVMDEDEKCFHFQCMRMKRMLINKKMTNKISSIFLEDTAILLRTYWVVVRCLPFFSIMN